ncbi:MAG: hypothetical protein B6242_10940 [Anaerolineaceae bacterium 4572_78]|nr:MAG: hypothetical protein B6242_10940 [Anaerolineaceae bacterium 4572_78]
MQKELSNTELEPESTSELTMAELLEQQPLDITPLRRGTIIKGTVVRVSQNELLVNVGFKYEGIVTQKNLDKVEPSFLEQIEVGDEIPVYIVGLDDDDGYVVLSLNKAVVELDWEDAQKAFEASTRFQRQIIDSNKGGVIVNFGAVRGFVPGSQLASERSTGSNEYNPWQHLIGESAWLKIIEVDRKRNRLIMSERLAVDEMRQQQRDDLLAELQEGQVRKGRVTRIVDYGAFVDIGGIEGLIHLSELAWTQVTNANEILKKGQKIEVYILNVDYDNQRLAFSYKRLQSEPWSTAEENYQAGQVVTGVITKLMDYGAFARIDNRIEGLIHISELSEKRINHPKDVVAEGNEIELRIISLEPSRKRMGLSVRQVAIPDDTWDGNKDAEAPESETPESETSESETPESETPESEAPESETPESETQQVELLENEIEIAVPIEPAELQES